jgi:hypothetical protein
VVAITNRDDISADLVVIECGTRGIELYRFNSEDFPFLIGINGDPLDAKSAELTTVEGEHISLGTAGIWIWRPQWPTIDSSVTDKLDIELARQESVSGLGGLLRLLADRCVSPPDSMQAARWKIPQLRVAHDVGLLVPPSIVTSSPVEAKAFASAGPTVVKAVAEARVSLGDDERIGFVQDLDPSIDWEMVSVAPVLLQRRVQKRADLRVTVVDRTPYAVQIVVPPGSPVDFRGVDPIECTYEIYNLAPDLARACGQFLGHFGLRFGAFDFALDLDGQPWFLECNPAGQWGWLEDATGLPITKALVDLLLAVR